jgi:DNA-binding MarR family transcriptional regulator
MGLAQPAQAPAANEQFRDTYLQSLRLLERLHRQLLDVIKDDLERNGRNEINSVQALLMFNIGQSEVTAGELRTRGHYLGSNVSYNLKKLVEAGYIRHERCNVDRRAVRISLTENGKRLCDELNALFDRQVGSLEPVANVRPDDLERMNLALGRLERYWSDHIRYRL